jgi:hypothetical protein
MNKTRKERTTLLSNNAITVVFFLGNIFAKCQAEKYDFDLCKRIFHEKNDPNFPDFYDNFQ